MFDSRCKRAQVLGAVVVEVVVWTRKQGLSAQQWQGFNRQRDGSRLAASALPQVEVLRTSKEEDVSVNRKGWLWGLVVQDACAHGVEDVKVAGLRTSGCGGQVGGLGHGMGAGWTASDAARASWTQYLQRPRGGGERPVGARCVAVWISARESTIAPDGLELICARQMGRR